MASAFQLLTSAIPPGVKSFCNHFPRANLGYYLHFLPPQKSMLTGEIRNQIDRIWDTFWSSGISNPLEVIEQIHAALN